MTASDNKYVVRKGKFGWEAFHKSDGFLPEQRIREGVSWPEAKQANDMARLHISLQCVAMRQKAAAERFDDIQAVYYSFARVGENYLQELLRLNSEGREDGR